MGIVRAIIDQPEELWPLVQMAWAAHNAKRLPKEPNLAFCYDMLNRVGRRYARDQCCRGPEPRPQPLDRRLCLISLAILCLQLRRCDPTAS